MPTAELMGLIVSRNRAVVSLANFSHITYLRRWPWRGHCRSVSTSFVVSTLSLFFQSDHFLSYPHSFSLAHSFALPPIHTLYLSTASLSHDSVTACERWVSHFVLLLLLLSSRCGLKGYLFGWDRAPCFCQDGLLTQRLSCNVSCWKRWRLPPDKKMGHGAFKKQAQHIHCYEDKWVFGTVWHIQTLNAQRYSGGLSAQTQEQQSKES